MLPSQYCSVVIEKQGDREVICFEPVQDMIAIPNPDNSDQIDALLLLCEKHSRDLDSGKTLVFVIEDTDDQPTKRIAVQIEPYIKENNNDGFSEPNPTP